MVVYYTLAVFGVAFAFVFSNGILFALSFLAVALLPCWAVGAAKCGIMAGDKQQRIGVPLVALLPLAFAYWLSGGVELHAFGYPVSGLALLIVSCLLGLTVPLRWGGPVPGNSN